ncbi:hypothetical protein CNR22_23100 [Sphingobacteriaceae bacterium]|nr:hypothetical protein CNR22_23100 [Sphingobacteriaceae bacterium]
MGHRKIILLIFLLVRVMLFSQQDPMYSMYMLDKMLINPAFAGSANWAVATIKHRQQFVGLNGHPSSGTLNFHAPIQKKHLGFGLKIINDKIAVQTSIHMAGIISYHLNFAGGKLSSGIEFGFNNRRINYTSLVVNKQGDAALPPNAMAATVPDASYGFYYQKKQFYAGFSQYHILQKRFNFTPTSSAHLYRHFYFLAGNVYKLSTHFTVEPSLLIKCQNAAKIQIDLNATVYYNDVIGLGLQLRTKESFIVFLKISVSENFKIAYAYDHTVSKLGLYSKGSHELIISYAIKLPPPPSQKEIHPRYYF